MEGVIAFIKDNLTWLGPLLVAAVLSTIGTVAATLINRRVNRVSQRAQDAKTRADEVESTVNTVKTGLEMLREELTDLRVRFGIRGQAIKEATPDQGKAVFARELELLEKWARKDKE